MSFPSPARLLAGLFSKPPDIVAYRAWQEVRAVWLRRTGGFARLSAEADLRVDAACAARIVDAVCNGRPALLSPQAVNAALKGIAPEAIASNAAVFAEGLCRDGIMLFGRLHPLTPPHDWSRDPVYGHVWPLGFFRQHDHYARREVPYDVKRVWEFGRLAALAPLLSGAILARNPAPARLAGELLADFECANPLAGSVQWYPMEASMRSVNLAIATELAAVAHQLGLVSIEDVRAIAAAQWRNAAFVDAFTERTDLRGNHYAANIVALALAGVTLAPSGQRAARWRSIALSQIDGEILGQFLADGVNFEKSLPYHRLVCELFLLGAAAVHRRRSEPDLLSGAALDRLAAAVDVLEVCRRPDGLLPNLGDNDDAKAVSLDNKPPRCIAPVIAMGHAILGSGRGDTPTSVENACAAWWFGATAAPATGSASAVWHSPGNLEFRHFSDGGYVVAQGRHGWFFADVGEVGMAGRGGHGHNDLLSFELGSRSRMLVIDPGAPIYTGDRDRRDRYRSSLAHNSLTVDDQEIAPFAGFWRIEPVAEPCDVSCIATDSTLTVKAGHRGYERIGSTHTRTFTLDQGGGRLIIDDVVTTGSPRRVTRRLHLAAGWEAVASKGSDTPQTITLHHGLAQAQITLEHGAEFRVEASTVSSGYDQECGALRVVVETSCDGSWSGRMTITMWEREE